MNGAIAAPATPLFPGAVAIVRVSGPNLTVLLAPLLSLPPVRRASLRTLAWDGYKERALVVFFTSPNSYTGEDVVEFQLHGNPHLVRRFLQHLNTLGIRIAEPGEFTKRALLNGKQSLLDAEALRDLTNAATDAQLRMAQARLGGVPSWIEDTKRVLSPWIARAEASVDYGEEENIGLDVEALKRSIRELRMTFHVERRRSEAAHWLRDGIRIAIVGRPNAGKSTLFNALAGEDRAIVTEMPGTTRDVLEVPCEWAGLPLYIFDTAGLRDTQDPVERLGVARVAAVLEKVDLILHLVPAADTEADPAILERLKPYAHKVMLIRNQADLASGDGLRISVILGDLQALHEALRHRFLGEFAPDACLGSLATERQRELLDELIVQVDMLDVLNATCPPELVASVLQGLWGLLAKLTGEDRAESSLDQVFSGFCLGK